MVNVLQSDSHILIIFLGFVVLILSILLFFFHQHYKLGCGFGCNCIECVNLQHILYFANDIIFLIKIGFCLFTGMSLILATLNFHQTNILNLLLILLVIRFFGAIFSSKKNLSSVFFFPLIYYLYDGPMTPRMVEKRNPKYPYSFKGMIINNKAQCLVAVHGWISSWWRAASSDSIFCIILSTIDIKIYPMLSSLFGWPYMLSVLHS